MTQESRPGDRRPAGRPAGPGPARVVPARQSPAAAWFCRTGRRRRWGMPWSGAGRNVTTTYMAAVALAPEVAHGEFCRVSVFAENIPGPPPEAAAAAVLDGLVLTVPADDPDRLAAAAKAAADALAAHGWRVRGSWWASDNALYADAVPDTGNPLYRPGEAGTDGAEAGDRP